MKRFDFSLERVLTVKKQLERQAEQEQALAALAVADARRRVAGLWAEFESVGRFVPSGGAVSPGDWVQMCLMSDRLRNDIDVAERAVSSAEQEHNRRKAERQELAIEVEALANMRQTQLDSWKAENASAEQLRFDEIGMRRWLAARPGAA